MYQLKQEEKRERSNEYNKEPDTKRRKIAVDSNTHSKIKSKPENNEYNEQKMDTDWQRRRREIIEQMERDEQERIDRIKQAKRLEDGWRLTRLCREYIRENSKTWQELDEKREEIRKEQEKEERLDKAKMKKEEFNKKQENN